MAPSPPIGVSCRLSAWQSADPSAPYLRDHALIDTYYLPIPWADFEPERGKYDFARLSAEIAFWKSGGGKSVTLAPYWYGGDAEQSPAWLDGERGVAWAMAADGGRVPAVWHDDFLERFIRPPLYALARHLHEGRGYHLRLPLGSTGHVNCTPDGSAARSHIDLGWTPGLWEAYCLGVYKHCITAFPKASWYALNAEGYLFHTKYLGEARQLASLFAARNVAWVQLNANADPSTPGMQHAYACIKTAAAAGWVGYGDDWPLWVPSQRRGPGPTQGRDAAWLQKALANGFVTGEPVRLLFCQDTELLASAPGHRTYDPAVEAAIRLYRDKALRAA